MPSASDILKKPLSRFRGTVTKGLCKGLSVTALAAALAEAPADGETKPDQAPQGETGAIENYAVISRGEALGHGFWCDLDFCGQVATGLSATGDKGLKSRFTHPSLSSDGLGKFLGRTTGGKLDGDIVRGSLKFSETAYDTPDGNLAKYVSELAAKDPEAFGASIVFDFDRQATIDFALANGAVWAEDGWGGKYLNTDNFKSPDPLNTKNLLHARLGKLHAVDIVDDPAANPGGLFHRGQDLATEADALFSYAAGITKEAPALTALDVDPERITGFFQRFLSTHKLQLLPAGAKPDFVVDLSKSGPEFLKAFGAQGGTWFAEGKSWEEAQALHTKTLTDENAALKKQIADQDKTHKEAMSKLKDAALAASGEAEPLSGGNQPSPGKGGGAPAGGKLASVLPGGLATFAANNPLPTSKL